MNHQIFVLTEGFCVVRVGCHLEGARLLVYEHEPVALNAMVSILMFKCFSLAV